MFVCAIVSSTLFCIVSIMLTHAYGVPNDNKQNDTGSSAPVATQLFIRPEDDLLYDTLMVGAIGGVAAMVSDMTIS